MPRKKAADFEEPIDPEVEVVEDDFEEDLTDEDEFEGGLEDVEFDDEELLEEEDELEEIEEGDLETGLGEEIDEEVIDDDDILVEEDDAVEEDDDEDLGEIDEEVEASLDDILKDRTVASPSEESEEDDDEDDDRSDIALTVLPKQPDEFVCQSCFLVKKLTQLADRDRNYCRDCV